MPTDCLLGLDLGTTTCRAMAFDGQGNVLAEARREVPPECEAPGLATVHSERWWDAACAVLREVMATLTARDIAPLALGLTGLMHAMTPLDAQGRVLAPSMLWMDQRCQSEVDWLNGEGRAALEAAAGPGARASTTPSLARLRWIAHHAPEVTARARWFLLPKDYIRFRLTGTVATDASDAGGSGLYDGRAGDWSPGLVDLALIRREQLPPILPSDSVAGAVTAEVSECTSLPAGLPVVVGLGDTAATRLGSLGADADAALIYIGTAAWVNWPGRGKRGAMLATTATGGALRWLRDVLSGSGTPVPYETLLAEAARVPAGAEGLIFLPHLSGERGPTGNPRARGVYAGLALCHGRGHLVRALLEGTCCHLRWLMEEGSVLDAGEIWAAGGGAHTPLWIQILADLLDRPLRTPRVVEAGALGAAMLAAVGAGIYADRAAAAAAMVHPGRVYTPNPAQHEACTALYARWREAERLYAPPPNT